MAAQEAVLYYFEGRGRAEIIRILLCGGQIKFREQFLKTREQLLGYIKDKRLLFQQVPLLEMDGKRLVQSNSIVRHIARIADLNGDNEDERTLIDTLYEGTRDAYTPFLGFNLAIMETNEELNEKLQNTVLPKYMPVYNKILEDNKTGYLVGGRLSMADLGLLELVLAVIDFFTMDAIKDYPGVQNFHKQMTSLPQIKHYISNVRHKMNDAQYKKEVFTTLDWN